MQTSSIVVSVLVKYPSTIPVSSTNDNPTRLSLSQESGASYFITCPATRIISIVGSLTVIQIVWPALLPWNIPWKGVGESLCKNYSKLPYAVMVWCSRSCNFPSMHSIGCAEMPSRLINIIATECTIRS